MFKVAIINEFGSHEIVEIPVVPRIGDTVPMFYKPFPKVKNVLLMPEKAFPEFEGQSLVAAVTV